MSAPAHLVASDQANAAIAEVLVSFFANDDQEWAEGYDQAERDEFVATIPQLIAALKSKGIAVVQLPEPTMHTGAGDPVWQTLIGSESEDVYFEGDETAVSGTCQLLPDELIPLAAALLAAENLINTHRGA